MPRSISLPSIPRRFRPPRLTRAKPAFRNGTSGARRGIKRSLAANGAALAANQFPGKGAAIGLAALPLVGPVGAVAAGALGTASGWVSSAALLGRLNRRRKISRYLDGRSKRTRGVYKSGDQQMSEARELIAKARGLVAKRVSFGGKPRGSARPMSARMPGLRTPRRSVVRLPSRRPMSVRRSVYKAMIEKARYTTRTLPSRFVQGGTRGKAGALSISGDTLYSYARPIARRKVGRSGKAFVHYAGEGRSSVTTARHISAARSAGMIGGPKRAPSGKRTHASTQAAIARRLRARGAYAGGASYMTNARINARRVVRKARNYTVRLSPAQRRKVVTSRLEAQNSMNGYSRTRGPFGRSKLPRYAPSSAGIYSPATGRRRAFVASKRSAHGKEWHRQERADAKREIQAYRSKRGEPLPYKRTLLGGLKRVRKARGLGFGGSARMLRNLNGRGGRTMSHIRMARGLAYRAGLDTKRVGRDGMTMVAGRRLRPKRR